jgi:subtilisin family serine protease
MMRKSAAWIATSLLLLRISNVVECQARQKDDPKSSIRGGIIVVSDPATNNDAEEKTKGFANFEPLHEIESTSTSSNNYPKPKTNFRTSSSTSTVKPKTHSQLDNIYEAHVQQQQQESTKIDPEPRRVKMLGSICEGIQLIVTCRDGTEEICRQELGGADVEIVHEIPNTDFFAVCVENEDEANAVKQLTEVDEVEDDPVRTLSYLPESEVRRELQEGQTIPYGVGLVKANDFWSAYNNKGSGKTVCVIDTGLRADHEDIKDGDLDGSNDQDLVTPWNQDGISHGTHVTGIIAAVDNNVGVVGVAPHASIYIARGKT